MSSFSDSNFRIIAKIIEKMIQALMHQGVKYQSNDGGSIDIIYKALRSLGGLKKEPPSVNIPQSPHYQINCQWTDMAIEELLNFNKMGDEYLCSTTEAVIKCNSIKRRYDGFSEPMFYRGEHIFGWEFKSRAGRKLTINWETSNPYNVTTEEMDSLQEFQNRCKKDNSLKNKIFGTNNIIEDDDPGWWSIMQHYDEHVGTRMIDLTSSLYCAMYFGCADWDGSVDSNVDGKLYMFPYPPGREHSVEPDRENGVLIGTEDQKMESAKEYFKVENGLDIPRFRISPIRNDRALSQDGYFVWQPYFDRPLRTFQIFSFRIHRDYKTSIIKELESMGYTKERILANNRFGT